MANYILVMDQGTTGSRGVVYDGQLSKVFNLKFN